jgi:hypothetical protein
VLQAKIASRATANKFGAPINNWLLDQHLCEEEPGGGFDCTSYYDVYAAALYWAAATITSIGYGDIAATAFNANEQVVATLLMLASAIFWALVVATFCGVVASFNPMETAYKQQMDRLNVFMRSESLPSDLRLRLRE